MRSAKLLRPPGCSSLAANSGERGNDQHIQGTSVLAQRIRLQLRGRHLRRLHFSAAPNRLGALFRQLLIVQAKIPLLLPSAQRTPPDELIHDQFGVPAPQYNTPPHPTSPPPPTLRSSLGFSLHFIARQIFHGYNSFCFTLILDFRVCMTEQLINCNCQGGTLLLSDFRCLLPLARRSPFSFKNVHILSF